MADSAESLARSSNPLSLDATGEMPRRLRETDWSKTALGPIEQWPASLRVAVGICMSSRFPMFVWWGSEKINIYNDAYIPILGKRHPAAFGKPAQPTWHEIWDVVGPQADLVFDRGEATWNERVLLVMERHGYTEDTYFTWSYSPIRDELGKIAGLFCACTEETARVRAESESERLQREREQLLRVIENERARLASAVAQAPAFICTLRGPEHVFELANEHYLTLVGGRSVVGKTVREALPEIEGQGFYELLDDVYRTGTTHRGDETAVTLQHSPGGPLEQRFLNFVYQPLREPDGSIYGIFVHGVDVTEMIASRNSIAEREALLRTSQERLALSVTAAELGTFYCPMPLGEIVWNEKCKEHFWLPPDAKVDFDLFYSILHPEDRERTRTAVEAAVYEKRGYDIEYRTVSPDGQIRWVRAKGRGYYDDAGNPTRFDGVTLDITEQKRVEAEMHEREARFRLLADSMPQIVWVSDAQGRPIYFNRRWYEYTGMPEEPVDDNYMARVMDAENLQHVRNVWAEAFPKGGPFECEYRMRRRDGEARWHLGRAVAIRNDGGEIVNWFGTATDIDDQKQAEVKLRESERRFRATADAAPAMLWITEADGSCSFLSRGWYEFTGQTPETGLGFGWVDAIHPEDAATGRDAFLAATKARQEYAVDFRVRRVNGEYRWVIDAGRPRFAEDGTFLGFVGSVIDIHERKRAEAEVRQSRDQTEMVVRGADVGIWFCELPFDTLEWDETVKSHFHLRPDTPVTIHTFYERLHPEDRERTRLAIEASIANHTAYDIDYRTVSPDGQSTKWIRAIGRTFYGKDGTPIRFDGITLDVSERKRIERDRELLIEAERAARAEAERVSHMKDEFLATLSHELRTPLNAMLGWAQILLRGRNVAPDLKQGLEIIERNARAQSEIIEDLLDMSRIIGGKVRLDVRRVDLAGIVAAAVDTAQPSAQNKGVRLQAVIDPLHDAVVSGDAGRLQQVLWNLISNAIKFTPKGGRVQVLLERVNSHVEVSVIDTGEGIVPDFLPHVFDRFRQADSSTTRRHGGLGLGLSIVKQLVELHGGTVRAKSAGPGKGSTFMVALPLVVVHEKADNGDRRHPKAGGKPSHTDLDQCIQIDGVRVLVVDDEADARALVKRLLEDCGAIVTTAQNAADAIAALEREPFEVLVSDIGMPGEDGYSLMHRVRNLPDSKNRLIPGIALTAYARSEDRVRAVAAGFLMHVAKPVEPTELIAMVGAAAGRTAISPVRPKPPE